MRDDFLKRRGEAEISAEMARTKKIEDDAKLNADVKKVIDNVSLLQIEITTMKREIGELQEIIRANAETMRETSEIISTTRTAMAEALSKAQSALEIANAVKVSAARELDMASSPVVDADGNRMRIVVRKNGIMIPERAK